MPYDYKVAKTAITENDKDRILCLFLNADWATINAAIDWEKATMMFDCASVSSMRVGGDGEVTPKPSTGKKRKGKAAGAEQGAEGSEETPTKKGKAEGKKKKVSKATVEAEDEETADGKVKMEFDGE
ncbi:hypothetical protein B0A50_07656 [Salinomyces thailandicus]|uniref:Uncharacterized protein n=1 Tax=Salinomyces thailandicus TaxID=706561 RepID=A0A4U0TLE1_9PEZI|nr:hypothetical protein B0A50_07656 [Salinomyces thailandica]